MKTLLAPVAIVAMALPVAGSAQQTGDLASVQRHLQSISTLVADFTQTDRAGKVLTGVLTLKQPGKIRFQYEKGVPILIVAEGGALTFIDYSVKQVQRWPIRNSPLGVLIDPSRDISRYAKVVAGGGPSVISVEANDPKHPEYGRITLVFARNAAGPAGLTMQGWVALDSQGNRTTVRLANQRYGASISDGTFRWNDPRRTGARN